VLANGHHVLDPGSVERFDDGGEKFVLHL